MTKEEKMIANALHRDTLRTIFKLVNTHRWDMYANPKYCQCMHEIYEMLEPLFKEEIQ